ncbi:MAG: hypothetical protein VXY91_01235 [Bacteroidota bacterium]|nr:hypothetical protein [Bacteroidota bacterium]
MSIEDIFKNRIAIIEHNKSIFSGLKDKEFSKAEYEPLIFLLLRKTYNMDAAMVIITVIAAHKGKPCILWLCLSFNLFPISNGLNVIIMVSAVRRGI